MTPSPASLAMAASSMPACRPPHFASLMLTMSPLPASIARRRSWIVNTDSSSTIGTGTRLRSSACPARSQAGSGCSRKSSRTPAASHASTAAVAVARSQAWFASTRTGLVAVRWISITRSTSDGSSPTLIFTWSKVDAAGPAGSHAAPCAAIVTSVPTAATLPPRNLARDTPAARASRSCTAISRRGPCRAVRHDGLGEVTVDVRRRRQHRVAAQQQVGERPPHARLDARLRLPGHPPDLRRLPEADAAVGIGHPHHNAEHVPGATQRCHERCVQRPRHPGGRHVNQACHLVQCSQVMALSRATSSSPSASGRSAVVQIAST